MKFLLFLVSLSVLIAGCSDDKSATVTDNASFSGMVDSQVKAMEKARAVEGLLRDANKQRNEQADQ